MALAPRGFVSKAQVDAAETELAVARAQKAQAQAALGTAQQALADTITRAPYDGVVTARMVDEGVYLNNRFSMGGQSAALELQELGIVAAIVNAPQEYVDAFRRNMPARVYIEGFEQPFDSTVYIINDRVDPESRMVELRLPIRNPDYRISSGLAVRAEISVPPVQAIVLPRTGNTRRQCCSLRLRGRKRKGTAPGSCVREYRSRSGAYPFRSGTRETRLFSILRPPCGMTSRSNHARTRGAS